MLICLSPRIYIYILYMLRAKDVHVVVGVRKEKLQQDKRSSSCSLFNFCILLHGAFN